VTADERTELTRDPLRRLKIEYEFFSAIRQTAPTALSGKVLSLLRKFSDGGRMSFSQRFRYNEMAQRYASTASVAEEVAHSRGRLCRPQDALLAVQGVRRMLRSISTSTIRFTV